MEAAKLLTDLAQKSAAQKVCGCWLSLVVPFKSVLEGDGGVQPGWACGLRGACHTKVCDWAAPNMHGMEQALINGYENLVPDVCQTCMAWKAHPAGLCCYVPACNVCHLCVPRSPHPPPSPHVAQNFMCACVGTPRAQVHPLRVKKLYVLAALEVDKFKRKTLEVNTQVGGVGWVGRLVGWGGGG